MVTWQDRQEERTQKLKAAARVHNSGQGKSTLYTSVYKYLSTFFTHTFLPSGKSPKLMVSGARVSAAEKGIDIIQGNNSGKY